METLFIATAVGTSFLLALMAARLSLLILFRAMWVRSQSNV